jgi:predicted metal-dependent peptidase
MTRPVGLEGVVSGSATADGDAVAARAVAGARAALVLGRDAKSAFFATLALRLTPVLDRSVPTLATDGRRLLYRPDFVLGLSKDERVGVLVHEVMHVALAHFARRAGRELAMWNVACDLAVNPLLLDAGFALPAGRLVPGEGTFMGYPPGKSAEEYFELLRGTESPDRSSSTCDSESVAGATTPDPGGCGAVIDPADGSPAGTRLAESQWKVAVAQADHAARGRGELPAGLGRTVEEVIHAPADWQSILQAFVSAHARNDYSWARPNRRYLTQGLFLPGLRSDELGDVVVAVDTSGSIGARELGLFASELSALLAAYDCRATILYHDTRVQKVETWTPTDGSLTLTPTGGGGTRHDCVFAWIEEADLDPACVVCLPDLETRFPTTLPAVPVLWAQVGDARVDPPFGQVIRLGP